MAHAYRFGVWRLVPSEHRLLHDDRPVTLTPKAFETLCVLVERHGHLVTTQALLEAVWPGTYVEQNNLAQQISALRRLLAESDPDTAYVETVPRRGYRFVAPVEIEADQPRHESPPSAAVDAGPLVVMRGPSTRPWAGRPSTQYARSGETSIAYQVVGDGPIDIVFVMGWVSHLDYAWAEPSFARFLTRLASFSRLILFDKRGTGLSDRVAELPSLEQRMDDVRAVMDAVGSTRAALLGVSEGGPMCSLFAATYPDKTLALVMIGSYARRLWAPDYPWAPTREQREAFFEVIRASWGAPIGIEDRAPSRQDDPAFREWWATYLRMGASPGAALALTRMNAAIDVREILGSVRVPTLLLHRVGDRALRVEESRYMASRIPGARLVELPGDDHLPFVGDQDELLGEIEEFLTGFRPGEDDARVLATVLHGRLVPAAATRETTPPERLTSAIRRLVEHFRGDAFDLATLDVRATFDGPVRAIRCAVTIADTAARLGWQLRGGLDIGEITVRDGRVDGVAVTRAATVAAAADAGEVLVSRPVHDLVAGGGLGFLERGDVRTPDGQDWPTFAVDPASLRPAQAPIT
ncbi:MAG TPA: alpha/beta fold hydrolase [Luteitalea sp.]|nr:alpha/beta fold hydrolase [Luteitalea sp.]